MLVLEGASQGNREVAGKDRAWSEIAAECGDLGFLVLHKADVFVKRKTTHHSHDPGVPDLETRKILAMAPSPDNRDGFGVHGRDRTEVRCRC